eukprot:CFRG5780T1
MSFHSVVALLTWIAVWDHITVDAQNSSLTLSPTVTQTVASAVVPSVTTSVASVLNGLLLAMQSWNYTNPENLSKVVCPKTNIEGELGQCICATHAKCTTLSLQNVNVHKINENSFTALSDLENLDLSTNSISKIDLTYLPRSLRTLNVDNNAIETVVTSSKEPIPLLHTFRAISNSLAGIEQWQWVDIFRTLPNLKFMTLSNNMISSLPVDSIPKSISTMVLTNNPLECCFIIQIRKNPQLYEATFDYDSSCVDSNATSENALSYTPVVVVGQTLLLGESEFVACDPCQTSNPCHVNATCTNTGNHVVCICNKGYQGDGFQCDDIDECSISFTAAANTSSNGQVTTKSARAPNCKDEWTVCLEDGTPVCFAGMCETGFDNLNSNTTSQCVDIDECALNNPCHTSGLSVNQTSNSTCHNTVGGYLCTCKPGFFGADGIHCQDVNECLDDNLNDCDKTLSLFSGQPVSVCTNTIGGYSCRCISQFLGTGFKCEDLDECKFPTAFNCPNNSRCENSVGTYDCVCDNGFEGTPIFIQDTGETVLSCKTCGLIPNCNETRCGALGKDEIQLFESTISTDGIADYGTDTMQAYNELINATDAFSTQTPEDASSSNLRCRRCNEGYWRDPIDLKCNGCRPLEKCATIAANCSLEANTKCATCYLGKTGQLCDFDLLNITQSMSYEDYDASDAEVLRVGLYTLLGVTNGTKSVRIINWFPGSVVVATSIQETQADLLMQLAESNSLSLLDLNITVITRIIEGQPVTAVLVAEDTESSSFSSLSLSLIVGLAVLGLIIPLGMVAVIWYRRKRPNSTDEILHSIKKNHKWTEFNTAESRAVMRDVQRRSGWLPKEQFYMLDQIGEGAYGQVHRAVVFHDGVALMCAIKSLQESSVTSREEFMREAQLLKSLNHANIVSFLGLSCSNQPADLSSVHKQHGRVGSKESINSIIIANGESQPPNLVHDVNASFYILLEYCDVGALRDYIIKINPKPDERWKLWISYHVAKGLEYLASMGVVHRDVAARNILLASSGSDKGLRATGAVDGTFVVTMNPPKSPFPLVKVSDMGLARVTGVDASYVKEGDAMLPLRWMPPESIISNVYTEKSDVWSYGITLWELFSNGGMPYRELKTHELMNHLENGVRLERPDSCPLKVYNIMLMCWEWEPHDRPTFADLVMKVEQLMHSDDLELSRFYRENHESEFTGDQPISTFEEYTSPPKVKRHTTSTPFMVNSSIGLKNGADNSSNIESSLDAVDKNIHSPINKKKGVPGYAWLSQQTKKR